MQQVAISNHATLAAHSYVRPSKAVEVAYWAKKAPNPLVHPKQYAVSNRISTAEFMRRLAVKVGVWCHDCNTIYCDCKCSGVAYGGK